jgi:hypothetical protein
VGGQDLLRESVQNFYQGTTAAVIVFDLCDRGEEDIVFRGEEDDLYSRVRKILYSGVRNIIMFVVFIN